MIYRERVTIEEMLEKVGKKKKLARRETNSSHSEVFVFPHINRALSKKEEDKLTSIVISLVEKIKQTNV